MRRLCLAACAALISFAATGAQAGEGVGEGCCWSVPTVVYAAPPVVVVVPPTGYLLDPSDARRPIYVVNQGPVFSGPGIFRLAVPTYSEGGYAYPYDDYPYVRSFGGDRWFAAPPRHRFGWRHGGFGHHSYGGRQYGERQYFAHPRIVRAGYGYGNVAPPYGAYRYRPAADARVIHVPARIHSDD